MQLPTFYSDEKMYGCKFYAKYASMLFIANLAVSSCQMANYRQKIVSVAPALNDITARMLRKEYVSSVEDCLVHCLMVTECDDVRVLRSDSQTQMQCHLLQATAPGSTPLVYFKGIYFVE